MMSLMRQDKKIESSAYQLRLLFAITLHLLPHNLVGNLASGTWEHHPIEGSRRMFRLAWHKTLVQTSAVGR